MRSHLCGLVLVANLMLVTTANPLETVYQWRYLDYVWPSKEAKQEAIQKGDYILDKPIPMDVDVSKDGRVFITSLNYPGVPARLGVVSNLIGLSGPLIQPYPNWNWTDRNDCDSIIDVHRIAIDDCNRLWVLDSAVLEEGVLRNCHPKLLAFDLWTDTLLTKVVIPEDIAVNAKTNQSLFLNVKVETQGSSCEKTTVYMADGRGNGLVIWENDQLYRIEGPAFNPRTKSQHVMVGNESSIIQIGVAGMDLSPKIFSGESRQLYFRPIASRDLYNADIESLKSSSRGGAAKILGVKNVLSSQSLSHAFSSEGTLFFGLTKEVAVACWNHYRQLKRENIKIVAQDSERLQYANGIKVISSKIFSEEELWLITNGYIHNSLHQGFDKDKINYRIWRSPVKKLIAGTKCEMPIHLREMVKFLKNAQ